jgi:hypothetical protein
MQNDFPSIFAFTGDETVRTYVRAAVAALILALALSACNQGTAATSALNVNDLRSDPGAYSGELTVTGIMAAVSQQNPQIFGIMDKTELTCNNPDCHKYFLPVRFEGQRPAHGDEVVVTGTFIDMPGGKILVAKSVNVLRNHKL